jgi:hypothetical protein
MGRLVVENDGFELMAIWVDKSQRMALANPSKE